jgi:hypothetical protein
MSSVFLQIELKGDIVLLEINEEDRINPVWKYVTATIWYKSGNCWYGCYSINEMKFISLIKHKEHWFNGIIN